MEIFETCESEVRGYCRTWPVVFERAEGCTLRDEAGQEYLDFFAGAGALNYGHNHPVLVEALQDHLAGHGIVHGLDMATTAKARLLEALRDIVLGPRSLDYKVQFPGPTGTNAVEAALKLARKVTGRDGVVGFTNAFHGMTLGSLAVTGNSMKRRGAGVALTMADSMPFDSYFGPEIDTLAYFEALLADSGSGLDRPAAVIVETTQAEGGVNVASKEWLQGLEALCRRHDLLLIVDDIQLGCGRGGPFFSFEAAGISPDIVCLSKSLSGLGLPLAVVLIRPELDVWEPGEHNGTFRGNNAAFVTATAALEHFWATDELSQRTTALGGRIAQGLDRIATEHDGLVDEVRGTGLIHGLATWGGPIADAIVRAAFDRGLVVETSGPEGEVVKLLPPLLVTEQEVDRAMEVLGAATADVVDDVDLALAAGTRDGNSALATGGRS